MSSSAAPAPGEAGRRRKRLLNRMLHPFFLHYPSNLQWQNAYLVLLPICCVFTEKKKELYGRFRHQNAKSYVFSGRQNSWVKIRFVYWSKIGDLGYNNTIALKYNAVALDKEKTEECQYLFVVFHLVVHNVSRGLLHLCPGDGDAAQRRPVPLHYPHQSRAWWSHHTESKSVSCC